MPTVRTPGVLIEETVLAARAIGIASLKPAEFVIFRLGSATAAARP